jgi:hypothetical protein
LGGNTACNSIWEAALQPPAAAAAAGDAGPVSQAGSSAACAAAQGGVRRVQHNDSWVWDDADGEGDAAQGMVSSWSRAALRWLVLYWSTVMVVIVKMPPACLCMCVGL